MANLTRPTRVLWHCVRYLLGGIMLTYGYSKLTRMQFQVSPFDYAQPLSHVSGSMLLWTTLGYKPWFQVLLGVLELIPALLLLVRRTARPGAVLMLPMLLNVVLFNYALDLWHDTKLISVVLLVMNLFLLAVDWRLYLDLVTRLMPALPDVRPRLSAIEATVAALLLGITAVGMSAAYRHGAQFDQDFTGERQINGAGTWVVESLQLAGKEQVVPRSHTRLYFDVFHHVFYSRQAAYACNPTPNNIPFSIPDWKLRRDRVEHCVTITDDGSAAGVVTSGSFEASSRTHTFRFTNLDLGAGSAEVAGTYQFAGNHITLDAERLHIVLAPVAQQLK